jgi:glutamine synthetase
MNLENKSKMATDTEHFLAAVVKALPALISLTCPTYNSLKRLMPDASVGATVGWGLESKEAPLRVLPRMKNIELKTLDHTANHYYVLAAILNIGRIGITDKLELPE